MALEDQGDSSKTPHKAKSLRVLDLCTGTGCIALLLHTLLAPHFEHMLVLGVDISPIALNLAQKNLSHNLQRGLLARRASTDIQFHCADVLGQGDNSIPAVEEILSRHLSQSGGLNEHLGSGCDLLISNPPYISTSDFRNGTTARGVRLFEPRLALVPPALDAPDHNYDRPEDVFYRHIFTLSLKLQPKVTVLECGDLMQAHRVVEMHKAMFPGDSDDLSVEVWPTAERDLAANGFHPQDGSRCVIIRRRTRPGNKSSN